MGSYPVVQGVYLLVARGIRRDSDPTGSGVNFDATDINDSGLRSPNRSGYVFLPEAAWPAWHV
jgi:hypothetical protein